MYCLGLDSFRDESVNSGGWYIDRKGATGNRLRVKRRELSQKKINHRLGSYMRPSQVFWAPKSLRWVVNGVWLSIDRKVAGGQYMVAEGERRERCLLRWKNNAQMSIKHCLIHYMSLNNCQKSFRIALTDWARAEAWGTDSQSYKKWARNTRTLSYLTVSAFAGYRTRLWLWAFNKSVSMLRHRLY